MSRDGSTRFDLAGQPQLFKLAIGEWAHLQEAFDAGPAVIVARFFSNEWKHGELITVLRFGLEGGGMPPGEAERLARTVVENQPVIDSLIAVQKILQVAYAGPTDELQPSKNVNGGPAKSTGSTTSRTAKSGSESSLAPPT